MRRRTGRSGQNKVHWNGMLPSFVLAVCFTGAVLLGCLMAVQAGEESIGALAHYLYDYMAMVRDEGAAAPSLWSVIWELCRWPVLVFLLGFTALGALAIPVIFCVRGFLLAYAVSAFLYVFGRSGVGAALATFGLSVFVVVPVLFLMANWAFPSSVRLAGGVLGESPQGLSLRGGLHALIPGSAMMAFAVFIQWSVMPQLLVVVSGALPIT